MSKFNLKSILSENTYNILLNYVDNGEDGVSSLCSIAYDSEGKQTLAFNKSKKPSEVASMLQALADPEYANIREYWGKKVSRMPYQANQNLPFYIGENYNSFALKARPVQIGFLRFPLVKNYMEADSIPKYDDFPNYDATKKLIAEKMKLNILEIENNAPNVQYKLIRKGGKLLGKILNPIVFFVNTGWPFAAPMDKAIKARLKVNGAARLNLFVCQKFNGTKLSNPDKLVAILDDLSKDINILYAKKFSKQEGFSKNSELNKMVYASQILTDIFISLAFNMSPENNKKIDNSLRLQFSNVLASMEDNPKALEFVSRLAFASTSTILKNLGLGLENITNTRARIGVTYVQTPKNLADVMFGATKNSHFHKQDKDVVYTGVSPLYEKVGSKAKIIDKDFNLTPKVDTEKTTAPQVALPSSNKQTAPSAENIEKDANVVVPEEDLDNAEKVEESETVEVSTLNPEEQIADEDLFEDEFIDIDKLKEQTEIKNEGTEELQETENTIQSAEQESAVKHIEEILEQKQNETKTEIEEQENEENKKTEATEQKDINQKSIFDFDDGEDALKAFTVLSDRDKDQASLFDFNDGENARKSFIDFPKYEEKKWIDNRKVEDLQTNQSQLNLFTNLDKEQSELNSYSEENTPTKKKISTIKKGVKKLGKKDHSYLEVRKQLIEDYNKMFEEEKSKEIKTTRRITKQITDKTETTISLKTTKSTKTTKKETTSAQKISKKKEFKDINYNCRQCLVNNLRLYNASQGVKLLSMAQAEKPKVAPSKKKRKPTANSKEN